MKLSDLHDEETRTTSGTGGQKGTKLTQIGALDPVALIILGRVAGMGANKYAAFNYLNGYEWSKSYDAMMRHANLFWAGEDIDPESGQPHIAHAAWMALSLLSFLARGIGTDNRPPRLRQSIGFDPGTGPDRAVTYLNASLARFITRTCEVTVGQRLCGQLASHFIHTEKLCRVHPDRACNHHLFR